MHHLAYDLPERTGFGGLWSSHDAAPAVDHPAGAWVPAARSEGARSPAVRAAVRAFTDAIVDGRREDVAA